MTRPLRDTRGSTLNRVSSRSNRRHLRQAIAGAAVAALLVAGCAANDDQALAAEDQTAEAAESALLPTVSGGQIDINSLEGTDTILWFWAPW